MRVFFRCAQLFFISFLVAGCANLNFFSKSASTIPAAKNSNTLAASTKTVTTSQQVALLLPLQGALGNAGQAIRDGFITAYNNDTSVNKPAHITIIDTSNQSIADAYNKAIQAHADMIVGPLAKNNVQSLVQANIISLPTLALNYLDNNQVSNSKLFQFGLSPLDEARQAAALAHQAGLQNALIIVPRNNWGQTLAKAYQNEWQAFGATVTAKLFYSDSIADLNQEIRNIVNANKNKFDVIFLAGSPAMARQIKPLLKYYYVGDVPVYATALVYTGVPQPAFDNDLNGIVFCDIPWTLTNDTNTLKLRQQIALFWPANFKQNPRLYALGIDAYTLVKNLPRLLAEPQTTLNGTTGNLTLNAQQLIVRQLTCAQFQRGVPSVLNTQTNDNSAESVTDDNADTTTNAYDEANTAINNADDSLNTTDNTDNTASMDNTNNNADDDQNDATT